MNGLIWWERVLFALAVASCVAVMCLSIWGFVKLTIFLTGVCS